VIEVLNGALLNGHGHFTRELYHAGFPTCEGHFTMELYSGFLNDEGHFTMELYHAGSSTSSTSPCVRVCGGARCAGARGVRGRAVRYARVYRVVRALVAQRCLRPLRYGGRAAHPLPRGGLGGPLRRERV
jgi:hypothetical protein